METSASEKSTSAKVPDIFCKTKSCSENCQFNHFIHYHCTVTECDFVTNKVCTNLTYLKGNNVCIKIACDSDTDNTCNVSQKDFSLYHQSR